MIRVFKNIDQLPVSNFLKVLKGDKRYLLILDDYFDLPQLPMVEIELLDQAWLELNQQIVDANGINDDYTSIVELQKQIIVDKCDMLATGDYSVAALVKKKEKQLVSLLENKNDTKVDWLELITKMEISFKFQFDLDKMTVDRLFKYIKIYSDGRKSDNR